MKAVGYFSSCLCEQNLVLSLQDLTAQTSVYSVGWGLARQGQATHDQERLEKGKASKGGDILVEP